MVVCVSCVFNNSETGGFRISTHQRPGLDTSLGRCETSSFFKLLVPNCLDIPPCLSTFSPPCVRDHDLQDPRNPSRMPQGCWRGGTRRGTEKQNAKPPEAPLLVCTYGMPPCLHFLVATCACTQDTLTLPHNTLNYHTNRQALVDSPPACCPAPTQSSSRSNYVGRDTESKNPCACSRRRTWSRPRARSRARQKPAYFGEFPDPYPYGSYISS